MRLWQNPPVFEMDFIQKLVWFQWLIALSGTITLCVLTRRLNKTHRGRRIAWSIVFTVLALVTTFITTLRGLKTAGRAQSLALFDISRFCAFENDLPVPVSLYTDTFEEVRPNLPWWWEFVVFGSEFAIFALLHLAAVAALTYRLSNKIMKPLTNWVLSPLKVLLCWVLTVVKVLLYLLPGAIWLTLCVWVLTVMQHARNDLQVAIGNRYQDSYWGFGQVTMVVMLLPSVIEVVSKIIGGFRTLPSGGAQADQRQSSVRSTRRHKTK
jgi:hypothetical protein